MRIVALAAAAVFGVGLLLVAAPFVGRVSATPRLTPFCAAVRAFNANRPPSKAESVASLQRLTQASPATLRTRLRVIVRQSSVAIRRSCSPSERLPKPSGRGGHQAGNAATSHAKQAAMSR